MEKIRFVQSWNPIAGRKQEYAAFISREFQPCMTSMGFETVMTWYTLVGRGPAILVESLVETVYHLQDALNNARFNEMLGRFMSLVTHYNSSVYKPDGLMTRDPLLESSPKEIKYIQAWDILPGQREAHEIFMRDMYIPQMKTIGIEMTGGWRLLLGSRPQVLSESFAPDLASVAGALTEESYLRLRLRMDELVTHYECHILIQQRIFLDMLDNIHGRAIHSVSPDAVNSMVGPMDE